MRLASMRQTRKNAKFGDAESDRHLTSPTAMVAIIMNPMPMILTEGTNGDYQVPLM